MTHNPIDHYLEGLDQPHRSTLESLRAVLLDLLPGAEECLAYGVPAIRRNGKLVAGFAAYKGHLSYLPHSGEVLGSLGEMTGDYVVSKGALRFPVDESLPRPLVETLVNARLAEIEGNARS